MSGQWAAASELEKLRQTINETKTRCLRASAEPFGFLGRRAGRN